MTAPLTLLALALWALPEREGGLPYLRSDSAVVRLVDTNELLLERHADRVRPIASVTKLMTALVFSRRVPRPEGAITLEECDKDRLKWSKSRLRIGSTYTSTALFSAALGASDNRAVYALVRGAGVERRSFVDEMNDLAAELGMSATSFADPAGIDPGNVSTAHDLLKLLDAVATESWVREKCLEPSFDLTDGAGKVLKFGNPNRLVRSREWELVLGKTGYIAEAGRNLVIRAKIAGRTVDMVFLGSPEMSSVFGDAGRVRRWLVERFAKEAPPAEVMTSTNASAEAFYSAAPP